MLVSSMILATVIFVIRFEVHRPEEHGGYILHLWHGFGRLRCEDLVPVLEAAGLQLL